jgi:hypothetical protein
MTFEDAANLAGQRYGCDEYFKSKTSDKLYCSSPPYPGMDHGNHKSVQRYDEIYVDSIHEDRVVDLDHYVTTKSLDGLFYMVGQEEKKIRTNPAARTTDLLKTYSARNSGQDAC